MFDRRTLLKAAAFLWSTPWTKRNDTPKWHAKIPDGPEITFQPQYQPQWKFFLAKKCHNGMRVIATFPTDYPTGEYTAETWDKVREYFIDQGHVLDENTLILVTDTRTGTCYVQAAAKDQIETWIPRTPSHD